MKYSKLKNSPYFVEDLLVEQEIEGITYTEFDVADGYELFLMVGNTDERDLEIFSIRSNGTLVWINGEPESGEFREIDINDNFKIKVYKKLETI